MTIYKAKKITKVCLCGNHIIIEFSHFPKTEEQYETYELRMFDGDKTSFMAFDGYDTDKLIALRDELTKAIKQLKDE